MPGVVDAVRRGISREIDNVVGFVRHPRGPFETIDAIIRDARRTVRDIVGAVTGRYYYHGPGLLKHLNIRRRLGT